MNKITSPQEENFGQFTERELNRTRRGLATEQGSWPHWLEKTAASTAWTKDRAQGKEEQITPAEASDVREQHVDQGLSPDDKTCKSARNLDYFQEKNEKEGNFELSDYTKEIFKKKAYMRKARRTHILS